MAHRPFIPNPMAIRITFTEAERLWCLVHAGNRQLPKEGERRCRDKRIAAKDNAAMHLVGILGEAAVARFLHLRVERHNGLAGDASRDLIFRGYRMEVKTLQNYLTFRRLADFTADVAVLVTHDPHVDPYDLDAVTIQGWIDRETFRQKHFVDDFGYGERPCMTPASLRGPEELLTLEARHD